jgi:hypothetical protein
MNSKEMRQFTQELLNPEIREVLRRRIPQIDQLELMVGFRDLKLTELSANETTFLVKYEAIASDSLYPHVRSRLMERGIKGIIGTDLKNKGRIDEHETVIWEDSGYSIMIFLKAYNPNYKRAYF